MLFSSLFFLTIFLPLVLVVTFCLGEKHLGISNAFLVVMSLIFYAWGEPKYVFLMLFSIVINYVLGLLIDRAGAKALRITWLVLDIVINLGLLGYFKYWNFFTGLLGAVIGHDFDFAEIALPIGISFYTFQIMSYIIDLYRGKIKVQRNVLNLALYISLFPQLIAGPIVRYEDVEKQIVQRSINVSKAALGVRRFIYGLAKKVIIANVLAEGADAIFAKEASDIGIVVAWAGALLYTFQIYYDFSGYSDMAIGIGQMLGFDFPDNFNYPYLSKSIQEFWRRWHISLGAWFREYLYFPLGGNRKGKIRTYVNLFIVFALTGLWHGASLNFVFWGLWHGFFNVLERIGLAKFLERHPIFARIYTFFVVLTGWVFFGENGLEEGLGLAANMVGLGTAGNYGLTEFVDHKMIIVFILAVLGCGPVRLFIDRFEAVKKYKAGKLEMAYCFLLLVASVALLAGNTYNPFIYFRF